jgi:hypothetical protein
MKIGKPRRILTVEPDDDPFAPEGADPAPVTSDEQPQPASDADGR